MRKRRWKCDVVVVGCAMSYAFPGMVPMKKKKALTDAQKFRLGKIAAAFIAYVKYVTDKKFSAEVQIVDTRYNGNSKISRSGASGYVWR